jgi:rRNA-processing protein FCF1
LVEVICDTNFLILLATKRIKNYFNLETEIGTVKFVVPEVVIKELYKLKNDPNKKLKVLATLDFIKDFKIISMVGEYADSVIINHVRKHGGIVGTLDKELKLKIKKIGGSIISFSNDRIVLESQ